MQFISTALDRTEKQDVAGSSSLMSAGSDLSLDEAAPRGIEANSRPLCRQFTRNRNITVRVLAFATWMLKKLTTLRENLHLIPMSKRITTPGRGGYAIYVPYGDVPPIRVYFLAFES